MNIERALQVMNTLTKQGRGFGLKFLTYDRSKRITSGLRIMHKVKLRKRRRNEDVQVDPIHYLFIHDMESNKPRTCWRCLVREVSFPPDFKWIKIIHYED